MAQGIRELLIKLNLDSSEVSRGLAQAESRFSSFQSKVASAAGAFTAVSAAAAGTFIAVRQFTEAGRDLNELSNAFKALGNTDQDLARLRVATQGLISDIQIFKSANLAEQFGLSQQTFQKLAESADALGDAVGIGTAEALESLTRSIGAGNERLLKMLGITIDNEKAQADFAAKIGTTADKLNEAGRKAAFQEAALKAVAEKTAQLSGETVSAADAFDKVANAASGFLKQLQAIADNSPNFAGGLVQISLAIQQIQDVLLGTTTVADQFGAELNRAYLAPLKTQQQFSAAIAETQAKIQSSLGQLRDIYNDPNSTPEQVETAERAFRILEDRLKQLGQAQKALEPINKGTASGFIKTGDAAEEAAKKFEEFRKQLTDAQLNRESEKLAATFDRIFESIGSSNASNFLDRLGEGAVQFNSALEQLRENVKKKTLEGFDAAFRNSPEAIAAADAAAEDAATAYREKMGDAVSDVATQFQQDMQDKIAASADFFTDAFYNIFTGESFDFEDIFKRLASGVLGGVLGNLFPEFGSFNSLQDFGQAIGSELLGSLLGTGGGGGGLLGSLLGGSGGLLGGLVGGAAGGGLLASVFGGGTAAAGSVIGPGGAIAAGGGAAGGGLLAAAGPYAAAAAGLYLLLDKTGVLEGNFGGTTNEETLDRRAFRERLKKTPLGENLNFQSLRGTQSLLDIDFAKFDSASSPFNSQVAGLVAPIADALTGGGKLGEDFERIFAQAVGDAKNFNEAIINTQALIAQLGTNVPQLKDQLTQAFLDGKLSVDEFSAGIANLNLLATDNLIGTGSVTDALRIVGDEATSNRAKLKGLELAFKEMAELGVDSASEINAYLTEKFGPGVADVFNRLAQAGIDSFKDIASATPDQIALIFSVLEDLETRFRDSFQDSTGEALNQVKEAVDEVTTSLERGSRAFGDFANSASNANRAWNNNGFARDNASVIDDNPKNFKYVP